MAILSPVRPCMEDDGSVCPLTQSVAIRKCLKANQIVDRNINRDLCGNCFLYILVRDRFVSLRSPNICKLEPSSERTRSENPFLIVLDKRHLAAIYAAFSSSKDGLKLLTRNQWVEVVVSPNTAVTHVDRTKREWRHRSVLWAFVDFHGVICRPRALPEGWEGAAKTASAELVGAKRVVAPALSACHQLPSSGRLT